LKDTHGRTSLGRFVEDVHATLPVQQSQSTKRDEAPSVSIGALLQPLLRISDPGSGWPSKGTLSLDGQTYEVDIYVRSIGGSARGRNLERRFQNPAQCIPIVDDPTRYELLCGIWQDRASSARS